MKAIFFFFISLLIEMTDFSGVWKRIFSNLLSSQGVSLGCMNILL